MTEAHLKEIADGADFIVNGYAFTAAEGGIRVINLERPTHAALLADDGRILETSMDDIEAGIVSGYFVRNREFLAA